MIANSALSRLTAKLRVPGQVGKKQATRKAWSMICYILGWPDEYVAVVYLETADCLKVADAVNHIAGPA